MFSILDDWQDVVSFIVINFVSDIDFLIRYFKGNMISIKNVTKYFKEATIASEIDQRFDNTATSSVDIK